jgi:hypothetical protein
MQLTNAQKVTLKNWVIANNASLFDQSAVDLLNAAVNPTYRVFRGAVPTEEVMTNGFDWTRVDNLSVGKARIWEWLTTAKRDADGRFVFDASKPNIRTGINATWVGTAADLAVRAAVYLHCFRAATVFERLYTTGGDGSAPNATGDGPGTLGVGADALPIEGQVTLQMVIDSESAN